MAEDRARLSRIRANLERRALICELTRVFFRERGFLEVETPVRMSETAPEHYISPFESEGWYLSTSPELYMKRLLAAGYERLFQFSRCFRKGERGRLHNTEFTLLEWYRAGAGYLDVLADTEALVSFLAAGLGTAGRIRYQGRDVDLSLPWRRVTVSRSFLAAAGWDPASEEDLSRFDTDLVDLVVPGFEGRPTLLLEYPARMASLSRLKTGDLSVAERGEAFVAGIEIANAFSELVDPAEQERRFREEMEAIRRSSGRKPAMPVKFLEALHKMPESGGIALGVDRLVMLFCDAPSIDDVIAFPEDRA